MLCRRSLFSSPPRARSFSSQQTQLSQHYGLTEQTNRNISILLGIRMEDEVDNWPGKLQLIFSAYNSSIHCTTGFSPNYIVFGRELVQPLDLILNTGAADAKTRQVVLELEERV